MMVKEILLAGAGGFAGSALRYAVSAAVVSLPLQGGLPVGTFAVNAAGSLAIGVLAAWLPPGGWQVF
ncbi:MAG: CrcB family protein [Alistipes inops]